DALPILTFSLEPLHDLPLLTGEHLGEYFIDTEFVADGLGGGPAVAGDHDDADALPVQEGDRLSRRFLDRIGHAEKSGRLAVDREEHHRLTVATQRLRLRHERPEIDGESLEELRVAERYPPPLHHADDALSRQRLEFRRVRQAESLLPSGGDDRGGQRMFAGPLEARREPKDV